MGGLPKDVKRAVKWYRELASCAGPETKHCSASQREEAADFVRKWKALGMPAV